MKSAPDDLGVVNQRRQGRLRGGGGRNNATRDGGNELANWALEVEQASVGSGEEGLTNEHIEDKDGGVLHKRMGPKLNWRRPNEKGKRFS